MLDNLAVISDFDLFCSFARSSDDEGRQVAEAGVFFVVDPEFTRLDRERPRIARIAGESKLSAELTLLD